MRNLWERLLHTDSARRGLIMLLIMIGVACAAPLIAPASPDHVDPGARLLAPLSRSEVDAGHPRGALHVLGTDSVGRDTLSRLIYASRLSLLVGFAAVLLGAVIGTLVGVLSGFFGGAVEAVTGWLIDVQLSFPFLLLAMFLLGASGGGELAVVCVLALATWVNYARIVRSQVLSIRNQGYVEAARTIGAGVPRLIFVHILPNTLTPLFVVASFSMAQAILTEASLSFIGLGLDPSLPSWGTMLNDGRDYLLSAWWISTMPGLAIGFTVMAVLMLGEGMREVLDPRSAT
jgi:peptide/nickel transport system permease protein